MTKKRSHIIKIFKSKRDKSRNFAEKLADFMTETFGTPQFLILNAALFALWIFLNSRFSPISPFDPYPFSFLTMAVSLEAIFLAIIVLISQNRAAKTMDIREELDLQINIIAQAEVTKIMSMINILLKKHGVDLSDDLELNKMLEPIKRSEIEENIEKQFDEI